MLGMTQLLFLTRVRNCVGEERDDYALGRDVERAEEGWGANKAY